MSKNMESKPATPSVIARLMGLDELPSMQPVKKQKLQRVLSENYLQKVACVGVWEKQSLDECCSFRFNIEEQKEFNDAFEVIESIQRDKESELFAEKGRVDLRLSHESPKLLQKLENYLVTDSPRKYGTNSTCMVHRFHLESNNERRHSPRNCGPDSTCMVPDFMLNQTMKDVLLLEKLLF